MTDAELIQRWTTERAIIGDGRKLAYALEAKIKDLEEQLTITTEQLAVAADRSQLWKNLCEHYKELAEARGEALAKQKGLDPHGRGSLLKGWAIDTKVALRNALAFVEDLEKELPPCTG